MIIWKCFILSSNFDSISTFEVIDIMEIPNIQYSKVPSANRPQIPILAEEDELIADKEYVLNKLRFTEEEFDKIMAAPPKKHTDYKSDKKIMEFMLKIWYRVKPILKS